jgi:alpha-1,6-mannosyltransferase
VAAAAVTLGAMAVVAAAPGSPYQPLLTPNGQPRGPLTAAADAIGLDAVAGNLQLALGVAVTVAAVAAFLALLRETFRGKVSVATVTGLVIAAHLLLVFVPLLFSRDVYSYAFYGRIAGTYGANPYVDTPLDHSDDMLWNYVGPKWVDTPAVYGPVWTSMSAWMSRFLQRPADHVEAYRLLAIGASLVACGVIAWTARRLWPERTAFALAAFGANPVVLFHSVASGHNDMLVALSIVTSLALVLRRRELPAVAVLTLGALVKAPAVLPLVLLIVWCVARRPSSERRRALVTHIGVVAAITLAFALPYMQTKDPSLGMVTLAGNEGWLAPSVGLGRVLDVVSLGTMGWLVRLAFGAVLLWAFVRIARQVWRHPHGRSAGRPVHPADPDDRIPASNAAFAADARSVGATWGWAVVLLTLLGPVLLPWYVVWSLPVVWLLPRSARTALIATSALLAVTLWSAEPLRYPGAFNVDLFVGRWIVTPVFLLLLLRALRDLNRRLSLGLPFHDDSPPLVVLSEPAPQQDRVPASTGQS